MAVFDFWRPKQHISGFPLSFFFSFLSLVYLVSVPSLHSIFSQSVVSVCGTLERVKGRKMITFDHSPLKLGERATCAHTHALTHKQAAMMDERSYTKGVNMIHGSFVGISPTHMHASVPIYFQLCPYSWNALFHQRVFFIMPDDSTSGSLLATKRATLSEHQRQERRREHSTHCLKPCHGG